MISRFGGNETPGAVVMTRSMSLAVISPSARPIAIVPLETCVAICKPDTERYARRTGEPAMAAACDNAVRSALYALGFGKEQKPHAFRTVARTLLVDELGLDPLMIEANLAHGARDRLGRSYNRTQYRKQRFEMVQQWADYLESLASKVEVSPLKVSS